MAAAGTITGTFGWSNTPLAQGMREAEQMAKSTGAKVSAELNKVPQRVNWRGLAQQRSQFMEPIRRGRTARDFAPAPQGKYSLDDEEGPRRGGGARSVLRGVGVIGLAHIAGRILKDMDAAQSKADELAAAINQVTSASHGSGAFRAIGDIDQDLSSLKTKLDELKAADRPTTNLGAAKKFFASGNVEGGWKEQNRLNAEQQHKIEEAITRDLTAQVEKQQSLTELGNLSLSGSEREAAIMKQQLAFKERMGAIDEKYQDLPGGGAARNALQTEAAAQNLTALAAINRAADLKEREVNSEIDLAMLRKTAVTSAQLLNEKLKERIRLNQQEAAAPSTAERRSQLSAERLGLESDLDAGLLEQSRKPFAQREAEIRAAKAERRELGKLKANKGLLDVHRDMDGNVIGGTDPYTNERVNLGGGKGPLDMPYKTSPDAYDVAPPNGMPYKSQLEPEEGKDGSGGGDMGSKLEDINRGIEELNRKWE